MSGTTISTHSNPAVETGMSRQEAERLLDGAPREFLETPTKPLANITDREKQVQGIAMQRGSEQLTGAYAMILKYKIDDHQALEKQAKQTGKPLSEEQVAKHHLELANLNTGAALASQFAARKVLDVNKNGPARFESDDKRDKMSADIMQMPKEGSMAAAAWTYVKNRSDGKIVDYGCWSPDNIDKAISGLQTMKKALTDMDGVKEQPPYYKGIPKVVNSYRQRFQMVVNDTQNNIFREITKTCDVSGAAARLLQAMSIMKADNQSKFTTYAPQIHKPIYERLTHAAETDIYSIATGSYKDITGENKQAYQMFSLASAAKRLPIRLLGTIYAAARMQANRALGRSSEAPFGPDQQLMSHDGVLQLQRLKLEGISDHAKQSVDTDEAFQENPELKDRIFSLAEKAAESVVKYGGKKGDSVGNICALNDLIQRSPALENPDQVLADILKPVSSRYFNTQTMIKSDVLDESLNAMRATADKHGNPALGELVNQLDQKVHTESVLHRTIPRRRGHMFAGSRDI